MTWCSDVTLRYLLTMCFPRSSDPQGPIAQRIAAQVRKRSAHCCRGRTSYGPHKSGSVRLAERVDLILSTLENLPLEVPADRHYGTSANAWLAWERRSGPMICSSRRRPGRWI
jgi:hypothetical protein